MIAVTVKIGASDTVDFNSFIPEDVMRQLLTAVLVGVAIAGAGLAAEAVFANPIHQPGSVTMAPAQSQHVHVLDPITINDGDR